MRKLALAAVAALALAGCQDPYGNTDVLRTGMLGAGLGGAAGLIGGAVAQSNERPRYSYGYGPGYYAPPRPPGGYYTPHGGYVPYGGYGQHQMPRHGYSYHSYGYSQGW